MDTDGSGAAGRTPGTPQLPGPQDGTRVAGAGPSADPSAVPLTVLDLPFGAGSIRAAVTGRVTEVAAPVGDHPPRPATELFDQALDRPVASARLEARARPGDRVVLIVSDATRDEPRAELVAAVRARLPDVRLTLAIATGTHGRAGGLAAVGLDGAGLDGVAVLDHDGHDPRELVEVGTTARGTPVRVHRAAVEADLVIATGVIRPHYFAGWGAGAKAIFPGLAEAGAARVNHRWKEHPAARAGAVDDNPCRLDLEEAARLAAPRSFLLDGVADGAGRVRGAVAGELLAAFRAGAAMARPWVRVTAARHRVIVVSDLPPVTRSLYQASKLVAAVAHLLLPHGTIVVVAPCEAGTGPLDVVNQGIYETGLRPRLPAGHRIALVSRLDPAVVGGTYARPAATLEAAIGEARDGGAIGHAEELLVVQGASKLLLDVAES